MIHRVLISEALHYKDMIGMIKPTIHVDEFAAKMGKDKDIVVLSFFVRNKQAADDLVEWFEKGYDWILDADISPGEISPGRYLVYVEARRKNGLGKKIQDLITDLETLTDHDLSSWTMTYDKRDMPFTKENYSAVVPQTPAEYVRDSDKITNEMRIAAGIEPKFEPIVDRDLRRLQSAAGM